MEREKRDEFEKRLLEERGRVLATIARLEANAKSFGDDGELTRYPLHLADEGTDAIEQEKELSVMSAEGRRLYEIDDALRTLYREPEQFGNCARCGAAIDYARLDLVPWANSCARCAGDQGTQPGLS
jgi:RNA polymerase-binding transcription factor DksA